MVKTLNHAFESLQPTLMKFVWITLQAFKVKVIKKLGGIDYHIPHMNKTKLAREERLVTDSKILILIVRIIIAD